MIIGNDAEIYQWRCRIPGSSSGGAFANNLCPKNGRMLMKKMLLLATVLGLMARARPGPDDGRAAQRRQEHRQRAQPQHGLRPQELQPAQADQQIQRQTPGADLEHQPHERLGRALGADGLQRRHLRHQRQVDLCDRRRDRQADLAHGGRSPSPASTVTASRAARRCFTTASSFA